jgi:type III restriction enzyme
VILLSVDLFGELVSQFPLASRLKGEVEGWSQQGWPHTTRTTQELLDFWFSHRDESAAVKFFECQQRAIETIIYCHEVLQIRTLGELFQKIAPDYLASSESILEEVKSVEFAKYCLKMATGTGKTWVLIALIIWQFFNSSRAEIPPQGKGPSDAWYSPRFLLVAPGREVLDRLLDAMKGRKDINGNRDPHLADIQNPLFMPEGWRPNFFLSILEPDDVRPNSAFPEGPFIFLTNWQQFSMSKDPESLWEKMTGGEIGELPRGDFLAEALSEFSSLNIMNDEAHHVHIYKGKEENRELVWRRFISLLNKRMLAKHKEGMGSFIQYDFSATPFLGSGKQKAYFSHIVYDFDLPHAMDQMLVKQLWLEEKQTLMFENLDFRALRTKPESGKRLGEIMGLSDGQKTLLMIGLKKLEQLTNEFRSKKIEKKPVMMVLTEETEVANLVKEHLSHVTNDKLEPYDEKKVLVLHTDLPEAELEKARLDLSKVDDDKDPLNVIVSVMMLREGFDRKNICVSVVLRATEAELLLEQIVGRGLRLMFQKEDYPEIWNLKEESRKEIVDKRAPVSSFDFLFIVEHPKFREFYQRLRQQGYLIPEGDTEKKSVTGDLVKIDAVPEKISKYNLAWPIQIYDQGTFPDLSTIDVSKLPPYSSLSSFEDLRDSLGDISIVEIHFGTGTRGRVWKVEDKYFSYSTFLSEAAKAVSEQGDRTLLSGHLADIASLIDDYVSNYLFGKKVDFNDPRSCRVLKYQNIASQIVNEVRKAILNKLGELRYEETGVWTRLSDVPSIWLREKASIDSSLCIYPKQGFAAKGGGFEKRFMQEVLNNSSDVVAYAKLDKKHRLRIPYRDQYGVTREYEVDFLVKTAEKMFLVETKADKDLGDKTVILKAKAGISWCKNASRISPPSDIKQPSQWEYLILAESVFKANSNLSFGQLVEFCRLQRDSMLSKSSPSG